MLDNLYTFSKDSNHVKFFKWIWDIDPTQKFKAMCPYFWAYVITILLLPIIIPIKLLLPGGKKLLNRLGNLRENLKKKRIENMEKTIRIIIADNNLCKAYNLYRSDWFRKNYKWEINYDLWNKLKDMSILYIDEVLPTIPTFRDKINNAKVEVKENKFLLYSTITISILTGLSLLGFGGYGAILLFDWIYWVKVIDTTIDILLFLLLLGAVGGSGYGIYSIVNWVIKKYNINLSCGNKIGNFFQLIGKGIAIFFDMIYNTYKKNCPIITWKDK